MKRIIQYIIFMYPYSQLCAMNLYQDYKKNLQLSPPEVITYLHKKKLCQTDLQNKEKRSSNFYRALLYQALKNCGHPQPEVVVLTNDTNEAAATSRKREYGVYVNFDQKGDWAKESYGIKRMIMHHEAVHVIRQDFNHRVNLKACQLMEIRADKNGALNSQCSQCVREFAHYFLSQHNNSSSIDESLIEHKNMSMADLDTMPKKDKNALIKKSAEVSRKRKREHPIPFERSLRLHSVAVALKDATCPQHSGRIGDACDES